MFSTACPHAERPTFRDFASTHTEFSLSKFIIRLYASILPHNFTNEQVSVDGTGWQRFIATRVPISAATQYQPNPRKGEMETVSLRHGTHAAGYTRYKLEIRAAR